MRNCVYYNSKCTCVSPIRKYSIDFNQISINAIPLLFNIFYDNKPLTTLLQHCSMIYIYLTSTLTFICKCFPSDYESKRTESAPVPAHTLVHHNISRVDSWFVLRSAAVAEIGQEDYYYCQALKQNINNLKTCFFRR